MLIRIELTIINRGSGCSFALVIVEYSYSRIGPKTLV